MNRTAEPHQPRSATSLLRAICGPTDSLATGSDGILLIEDCRASDLLHEFGSPLYVVSERTLRLNYRRLHAAFTACWPAPVSVLYAIKANNCRAIRCVLSQEGAGGECFGLSELQASLDGGTEPARIAVNGSNKTEDELRLAVRLGCTVNLDNADEVDQLVAIAGEVGCGVNIKMRLKPALPELAEASSDYFGVRSGLAEYLRHEKWGFSPAAALGVLRRIRKLPELRLTGFSMHVGRVSRDPALFGAWARVLGRTIAELHEKTGFVPQAVDIGGGWPRERDPESRALSLNPVPIETYARSASEALLAPLRAARLPVPELWIEPGRYLVGNAVVLLTSVGTIKRDDGLLWVNVDASTNNLMRIDTSGSRHHILPASGMRRRYVERATVVGNTCIDSVLGVDVALPRLARREPLAILDAGMYAESASTQFNGVPRPATVLVNGSTADLVKRRESSSDVFATHIVPNRFRPGRTAWADGPEIVMSR